MVFVTEAVLFLLKQFPPLTSMTPCSLWFSPTSVAALSQSFPLSSFKYSSAIFFRAPFSSHPTFLYTLPNVITWITTYILTTPKSLSLARFFPQPYTHVSISLMETSSLVSFRPLGLHVSKYEHMASSDLLQSCSSAHVFFVLAMWQNTPKFLKEET